MVFITLLIKETLWEEMMSLVQFIYRDFVCLLFCEIKVFSQKLSICDNIRKKNFQRLSEAAPSCTSLGYCESKDCVGLNKAHFTHLNSVFSLPSSAWTSCIRRLQKQRVRERFTLHDNYHH